MPAGSPKGDKSHAFVSTLRELVEDHAAERQLVMKVRKTYAMGGTKPKGWEEVPRECYAGGVTAFSMRLLNLAIDGYHVPNEGQLANIALDYGMDEKKREAFIELGKAYADHCRALPEQPPKPRSRAAAALKRELPVKRQEEAETLKDFLLGEIAQRWVKGDKILTAPVSGAQPMNANYVKLHHSGTEHAFLTGHRPDPQKKTSHDSDRQLLEAFLTDLQITGEKREQALALFEQKAQGSDAGQNASPEGRKPSGGKGR